MRIAAANRQSRALEPLVRTADRLLALATTDLEPVTAISALYEAVLGRETDPAGLEGWSSRLEHGTPLIALARELADTAEAVERHDRADGRAELRSARRAEHHMAPRHLPHARACRMKPLVANSAAPFVRAGAELLADRLVTEPRRAGHEGRTPAPPGGKLTGAGHRQHRCGLDARRRQRRADHRAQVPGIPHPAPGRDHPVAAPVPSGLRHAAGGMAGRRLVRTGGQCGPRRGPQGVRGRQTAVRDLRKRRRPAPAGADAQLEAGGNSPSLPGRSPT